MAKQRSSARDMKLEEKTAPRAFKRRTEKKEKYKKKYGTKNTGKGFTTDRKSAVVHHYNKMLRKDKKQQLKSRIRMQKIYEDAGEELSNAQQRESSHKVSSFHKEEMKWKKLKNEKDRKRRETKQRQVEKDKALKKYRENKRLVHKKLSKKNYKGQPNMAAQMEVLLKKIEASKS